MSQIEKRNTSGFEHVMAIKSESLDQERGYGSFSTRSRIDPGLPDPRDADRAKYSALTGRRSSYQRLSDSETFATPLLFGSAIAIAIWPVRQCLVRSGIRRGLAALLLFCLIIGIILLPMLMIAPHMAEQLSQATQRFQTFFASTPAKPVWIGFGVDMPLSLTVIGVFGGFIVFGFLGLFLGPTLLAIVYRLFMAWRAAVELHPTMGSGMRETRTHSVGQQNSGRRVGGN